MGLKKLILRILKNFKFLPIKTFLAIRYQYYTGKKLNLENPVEFNEKIQWLKLFYHVPLLTQLADKYAVRNYVAEKIGKQYLSKIYGVYEEVNDIDFDKFPEKFVLKAVHGSSTNLIVTDKTNLDLTKTRKTLNNWIQHNQYKKVGFEWAYRDIKPRIICEAFIENDTDRNLIDYKFYCFNGKPKFVFVSQDIEESRESCIYDLNWNKLPFSKKKKITSSIHFDKPTSFDKMIGLATRLADKLPFVRVDFYFAKGSTIFGEMTFYPADGRRNFYPDFYNKTIGDYLVLPKIPADQKTITKY